MSIASLKRASTAISNQYRATADAEDKKRSYGDENYWSPVLDKSGVGSAVIRFLPGIPLTDRDDPNFNTPYVQSLIRIAIEESAGSDAVFEPGWVRKWQHGFQGPSGQWYIENSRNSMESDSERVADPVSDFNSKLWRTKDENLQAQVRKQKRKLLYISNIQVLKHPARPEDEGKVFLFAYGQKIMDKIKALMNPADKDQQAIPVFDLWQGANFRLKIRKVSGYRNYDDSLFDPPKALSNNDDELEAIYGKCHSLLQEVGLNKFKSYEELEKRLNDVLDDSRAPVARAAETPVEEKSEETTAEEPPFDMDEDKPSTTTSARDFFAKLKKPA